MSELFDEFLPTVSLHKAASTARHAKTSAKPLNRFMGRTPIDEIDYRRLNGFLSWRCKTVRTRTAQIDLRALRQALIYAKRCGLLERLPEFPIVRITDAKPHVWLTAEQTVRLLDALRPLASQPDVTRGNPPINRDRLSFLAILMAVNTGMRKGEILSRGWEDVSWDRAHNGVLLIGPKPAADFQVKTRRSRVIPLTPELAEALRAEHELVGEPARGWIFPSPKDPSKPRKNFIKALRRACATAGLEPIHPHALRHTWASRLAMAGVDRQTLMVLGGWKDGRMLDEVYAH
ncbi:MAG: tyrosine-type recombinase/integrase, partial [Proteobacteria bacterium]|nr:tyrosine-type recombinase/integrase [Pseudomonadota bacterium]